VTRGIDLIETVAAEYGLDAKRVGCMGNSGGGTTTYYAAALDTRIAAAMPSCVVCNYGPSLGSIGHCSDNYLPSALRWFDMGDVAAMIAPRPLVVVAGREDDIFPIKGVEAAYATIEAIYRKAGAVERCRLVVGAGGHRFYAELGWAAFRSLTGW
jgi:cephalosporin-C deacetylase-like acetyl esterase